MLILRKKNAPFTPFWAQEKHFSNNNNNINNNNNNNNNNTNNTNNNNKCRSKLDAGQKPIIPERIIYSKNICARILLNFCKKRIRKRSMFQRRM